MYTGAAEASVLGRGARRRGERRLWSSPRTDGGPWLLAEIGDAQLWSRVQSFS